MTSRYTFDLRSLRFRNTVTGRFVEHSRIFSEFNKVIRVSEGRMLDIALSYQRGFLTLPDFKLRMRAEIKNLHIAAALVANGGLHQMDAKRWGEVGARLRKEFAHLNDFGSALAKSKSLRESGRMRSRARSYVHQARIHFWETTVLRMRERHILVEARRRTGAVQTEHCAGCVREAARGWLPLGELAAIGSKECLWFCQCSIEFRLLRVSSIAEQVADIHNRDESGGSTFNLFEGNLADRKLYAVSIYPERSRRLASREVTPEIIEKYIRRNLDLLTDPRHSVGTFFNPETGKTWLDVVATLRDKNLAVELGKTYNQEGVFDLKRKLDIPTGGDGRMPSKAPPLHKRLPQGGD